MNLDDFKDFTPGPWEFDGGERDGRNALPKWTLIRRQVFDTEGMVGTGIISETEHRFAYLSADEPNAQLISSAPDLLAKCRRLTEENGRYRDEIESACSAIKDGLTELQTSHWIQRLRATIREQ